MQGLFLAPGMVGEAVKGSHLIAAVMAAEGYETAPTPGEPRHDVITSVVLRSPKRQARLLLRPISPPFAPAGLLSSRQQPAQLLLGAASHKSHGACYSEQRTVHGRRFFQHGAPDGGGRNPQVAFCQAVQKACPIGAYIRPEPAATPGYASDIIFANGTFIEGSTAELSSDGPLRPPFVVYCQASAADPVAAPLRASAAEVLHRSGWQAHVCMLPQTSLCWSLKRWRGRMLLHCRQGGTHWTHWAIALERAVAALREFTEDREA